MQSTMPHEPVEIDPALLSRAARLIGQASHAVALTGAGLSTRSGIPDFRSPGSGLWERHDPMEVASIYAFRRNPDRFYAWIRPLIDKLGLAKPNAAHRALAALEAGGRLKAIITQNVDGLHQRAGSREVLELHGDFLSATCTSCGLVAATEVVLEEFVEWAGVPRCASCAGVMKPNVVFIGEQLPAGVVSDCRAHLRRADVLLVAGSSLEMAPASELPVIVNENGGHLIIVNLGQTHLDGLADLVIRADVVEVLPQIAALCGASPAAPQS